MAILPLPLAHGSNPGSSPDSSLESSLESSQGSSPGSRPGPIGETLVELAAARDRALQEEPGLWDEPERPAPPSRLVHLVELPARAARTATLARPLPLGLTGPGPGPGTGAGPGTGELWSHQVEALDLARAGRSVVVATGTGSGKSRCYQLAIGEAVAAPIRPGTGLILFPTKALAHDQLRALTALGLPKVVAGAYDGDASAEERTWIRKHANVVLTNPEMLHAGLLPHHERWATFLGRLRYVVIDELHTFRGTFGGHVAQLVRRLRRLAAHHGAEPTFICCSATLGEPQRLASAITGVPVTPVIDDGAPRPARTIALWQPPLLDEATGARSSAHREAAAVTAGLVDAGHTTLTFTRSRRAAETVAADVRRRVPPDLARGVRSYRGGYLADERRAIEDELFAGELTAVVATSALELGIDVGGGEGARQLDVVVLDGFPGTVASFWQQAGRAGRAGGPSGAVLVAGDDQLDQWFVAHPEQLLARPPEPSVVNPDNPYVVDPHLRCAAHELPLTHADERWWGPALADGVRRLALADELIVRHRGRRDEPIAVWNGAGWPTHGVGLRTAGGAPVQIVDAATGQRIGDVDGARAPAQVHRGASYLHQGQTWRVTSLELGTPGGSGGSGGSGGIAEVVRDDGLTYTVPRSESSVRLLEVEAQRPLGGGHLHLGAVEVCSRVVGFQRKEVLTGALVGSEPLDLPESVLRTRAVWWVLPAAGSPTGIDPLDPGPDRGLHPSRLPGALHAAEHASIGMLPLFAICDRWDVGGLSTPCHADTGLPTVIIYDAVPGGAGVAELGYAAADQHLRATRESIVGCPCAEGCPSCVQSPKCGNGNEPLDKQGAVLLLDLLVPG